SRRRAGKAPGIEREAHRAIGGDVEVRLELVDGNGVVVHLDGRRPTLALVVGRSEEDVYDARAVVLPCHVERVFVISADRGRADREDRKSTRLNSSHE